jgi:lipopolysaccharide transport system permease protein
MIEDQRPRVVYRAGLRPKLGENLRALIARRDLLIALAARDVRVRYRQSLLGVGWAVLQPLGLTLLFSVVFSLFLRVGTGSQPYAVVVLAAIVPWTFVANTIQLSTSSVVNSAGLLTKVSFPREVFPLAQTLAGLFDLGLALLVLIGVLLVFHVALSFWILAILPALAIQAALTTGVGLLVSALTVFYRDIRYAVPLALQAWMFISPVAYPISAVPERYLRYYEINPMVGVVDTYRRSLVYGEHPQWLALAWSAFCAAVLLYVGYLVFKRVEPYFADVV